MKLMQLIGIVMGNILGKLFFMIWRTKSGIQTYFLPSYQNLSRTNHDEFIIIIIIIIIILY